MRTAIGLIVLGLVGGVLPTGLAGSAHAAQVLAGTVGALLSLLVSCVAVAARRSPHLREDRVGGSATATDPSRLAPICRSHYPSHYLRILPLHAALGRLQRPCREVAVGAVCNNHSISKKDRTDGASAV